MQRRSYFAWHVARGQKYTQNDMRKLDAGPGAIQCFTTPDHARDASPARSTTGFDSLQPGARTRAHYAIFGIIQRVAFSVLTAYAFGTNGI
jgi:hypothetical protein